MNDVVESDQALEFVRQHGVVLMAAKGPVPRLVEAIAGEPIRGSWWAHPQSRRLFATLQPVLDAPDVLVCRAVAGKITLVHRRLWPALVRLAARFPSAHLAQVREEHTESGQHATHEVPFPQWVPALVKAEAMALSEEEALSMLGAWLQKAGHVPGAARSGAAANRRARR